jgi:hypothetical protein
MSDLQVLGEACDVREVYPRRPTVMAMFRVFSADPMRTGVLQTKPLDARSPVE